MAKTGEPGVDLDGIREYLDGTPVVFAVLFGSHARGTADSTSDVDVALRFPDGMDAHERFRARNRIDAELQRFADGFVDASDIETLPTSVAVAALRDGVRLVGDEDAITSYRERIERAHDATAAERERERQAFIDRLARGDV